VQGRRIGGEHDLRSEDAHLTAQLGRLGQLDLQEFGQILVDGQVPAWSDPPTCAAGSSIGLPMCVTPVQAAGSLQAFTVVVTASVRLARQSPVVRSSSASVAAGGTTIALVAPPVSDGAQNSRWLTSPRTVYSVHGVRASRCGSRAGIRSSIGAAARSISMRAVKPVLTELY